MDVNEFCTCGAKLPEGARFCHKCGKPQYELVEPEPEAAPEPTVVPEIRPEPAPPALLLTEISMRNPFAVRAAFLIASLAAFLTLMPLPPEVHWLWQIILLVAGGFGAVWLYQKRTGAQVNVRGGARLGWMTGTFCFLILLVMFTILFAAGGASELLQEISRQMESQNGSPEVARQFDELVSSPAGAAILILFTGMLLFLPVTLLATAGGALGAKILEKE